VPERTLMSHEGEKTLLYGDYRQYDPEKSIFVNLFDLAHADPCEHFLSMLILDYLGRLAVDQVTRGFAEVRGLYSYMESFGFTIPAIDAYLARLYHRECIQGPVPGDKWTEGLLKYRITSHGRYHIYNLARSFQYVDAVVIDTPILDDALRATIMAHEKIRDRVDQAEKFVQYLDSCSKGLTGIDAFSLWRETVVAIREDLARVRQSFPSN